MTFLNKLKAEAKKSLDIFKRVGERYGETKYLKVTLSAGKEHSGIVTEMHSDFFVLKESHAGGGKTYSSVKFVEVASFHLF
jgi:peptide subunit release factor RF-3